MNLRHNFYCEITVSLRLWWTWYNVYWKVLQTYIIINTDTMRYYKLVLLSLLQKWCTFFMLLCNLLQNSTKQLCPDVGLENIGYKYWISAVCMTKVLSVLGPVHLNFESQRVVFSKQQIMAFPITFCWLHPSFQVFLLLPQ